MDLFQRDDFMPLPCAHPNCHTIAYAFRNADTTIPADAFYRRQEQPGPAREWDQLHT